MNTWQHVSTIDINAYCTWSQGELTSPLGDTSCFATRQVHLGNNMMITMRLSFILVNIDMFL
jgi:hypothetical protein